MIRSILIMTGALLISTSLLAKGGDRDYEVTITNITKSQIFTPILAVTHDPDLSLFELGEAASPELATIAESGNIAPLRALLDAAEGWVQDTNTNGALLYPGDSTTIEIGAGKRMDHLSFVGMLIPSNDTFVAISGVSLPKNYSTENAKAYDAGSEANDELCANIPGPYCGDMDDSGDAGEGYVYIGNGIHGTGDLDASEFDWNNPVARVVIRRVK